MGYEDDLPPLKKPPHVSDEAWRARMGDYAAALALFKRTVAGVSDAIRAGRMPTDDQRRAEDLARELLTIARTALLDLSRSPLKRD